jgi:putative nucleotidyltransferase with HDIG domain
VAELALRLADALGLGSAELTVLHAGALLHDVGRVGVSDVLWLKPGRLTELEQQKVRLHTVMGAEMLERLGVGAGELEIVRHHHERWDGAGYPDGLSGEAIPGLARVVSVVDGFEALTTERPWRPAKTQAEALAVLEEAAGSVYDPELVRAFVTLFD